MRNRAPRRAALVIAAVLLLVTVTLACTYHVGTDSRGRLVVRWGLPGFDALPGAGADAVVTDWSEHQLTGGALPADRPLAGVWLGSAGELRWGRQLASRLDDPAAALALWRLGDAEAAGVRLRRAGRARRSEAVEIAAYLAVHDSAFAPVAIDAALDVLAGWPDTGSRRRTHDALARLARIRPEVIGHQLAIVGGRLADAPPAELPALVEVVSALASEGSEPARRALGIALERLVLSKPADSGRLADATRHLLASHAGLAAEHRDEILALVRRPEQRDRFLGWLEALAADRGGSPQTRALLIEQLRLPGPGRAAGLALLGRVLGEDGAEANAAHRLLEELAGDPDPEVILAAAAVIGGSPVPGLPAQVYRPRLAELARRSERPELARQALSALAGLDAEWELIAAARSPGEDVRAPALAALVERALERPFDRDALSATLATGLRDPAPGVRREAALGVLLLTDRLGGEAAASTLYEAAFGELTAALEADRLPSIVRLLAGSLARATPVARGRLCRRLVGHLVERLDGDRRAASGRYEDLLLVLIEPRPEGADEIVAAVAPLLSDPRGGPWMRPVIERLCAWQRRSPERFGPIVERLVGDLAAPDVERRRAAAYLVGPLAGGGARSTARARESLTRALAGPDPVAAAGAAASLAWLARGRPDEVRAAVAPLWAALTDERPAVRRAAAGALSELAETLPPPFEALPPELERALADPDAEVRSAATLALRRWSERSPAAVASARRPLAQRFEREDDPAIRTRLAATAVIAAEGEPGATGRWLAALGKSSAEAPAEEVCRELGAVGAARPDLARWAIERVRTRWRQLADPAIAVPVLSRIGRSDAAAGRAALAALKEMLLAEPGRVGREVLIDGVAPIVRGQPRLRPEALRAVERARATIADGGEGLGLRPLTPGSLEQAVWELWVELAASEAARDPRGLWRGLTNQNPGGRRAALAVLARLAAEHPQQRPELARRLDEVRRSRRPEVRLAAAMGLEVLTLLELAERSGAGAGAWRDALAALPEGGAPGGGPAGAG